MVGTTVRQLVHPDDVAAVAASLRDLRSAGGQPIEVRARLRRADGSWRWVSSRGRALHDDDGAIVGIVAGWRDAEAEVAVEESLARSAREASLLAERGTDIVFHGSTSAVIQWISPSVVSVLGHQPGEMIGHRISDFIHPDDVAAMRAASSSANQGQPVRYRARLRRAGGSWLWMEVAAEPLLDETGIVVGRVGSARDISAQVAAEESAERSAASFRLLAENASDIVFRAGPDRRITWISPNVSATLGWDASDLIGTRMSDLWRPAARAATDEDRAALYSEHTASPTKDYLFELRAKDGTYHWFSGRAVPEFDERGHLVAVCSGLKSVDDLVTARDDAQRQRRLLRAVIDSELDPRVVLEPVRDEAGTVIDFTYIDANPAAHAYLRVADDLIGARLLELFPGQKSSGLFSRYVEALETRTPLILQGVAVHSEVGDREGRFDFRGVEASGTFSLTWRDVTAAFESAEALKRSEER